MQFVRGGPDIPEQLLQAHEDGRVVFFCGAGISYPAGLPGFGGLVARIYQELGVAANDVEKAALKGARYDTAISLLESRIVGSRSAVRTALASILKPDLTRPRATQTHEALLTLSKNGRGQIRLITTNFDRLFEEAKTRIKFDFPHFNAPLLPIPKKKWDGLVYLHGLLTDSPHNSDLDRLVVSSGDFGLAYLTERWAARFVSELFRNYTVCFVGYSINDPVLRYMMDALAADKLLGEAPLEVFAFGSYARGKEEQTQNEWAAKNVTPILYRNHNKHAYLHHTLHAWAETYRDGIRGKESIVARHAAARPIGSTRQDDFIGRMLWALSDRSGLPAKRFADHTPVPHIDWLEAFAQSRFGHRDLMRFGVAANEQEDKELKYSLLARPASYTHTPWMQLVSRPNVAATRWDSIMPQIARWLTRHLDEPRLVLWIAQQGGRLEESFEFLISHALEVNPPSTISESLWRLVLSRRLSDGLHRRNLYDWGKRLARKGLTPLLKMEFREMLSPRVRISEGYYGHDLEGEAKSERERVKRVINWEIVLETHYVHSAIESLSRNENWQATLPELLTDITDLLVEALDMMRGLGDAGDHFDESFWQQPSISRHPQNRSYRDWTALIDLARDAWLAAAQTAPSRAIREAQRWLDFRYPLFRRLAFFAAAERPDLFALDEIVLGVLSDDGFWLWTPNTQRETLRLIIALAPQLPPDLSETLQNSILQGPPIETDGDEEEEAMQTQRIQDRKIWHRLSAFSAAGGALIPPAAQKLKELAAAYPQWETAKEQDEFPVWVGSGDEWRRYSATPKSRRKLEEWLRENPRVDDLHREDDFRERCRTDFPRTVLALLNLARSGEWPVDRWRQALQAWSEESLAVRSWRCLNGPLREAPEHVTRSLNRQLGYWLKSAAKTIKGADKDAFFVLVRRLLEINRIDHRETDQDVLNAAINHPVGHITEAALSLWYACGLEDNQRLGAEFEPLFTEICDQSVPSFRHGRTLLCTHAITLFRVDKNWTAQYLLPQFDWSRSAESARAAWIGFLWSPRLYWPLLTDIKAAFLETAAHYEVLGELGDQYVAFLTFAALERPDSFTNADFAKATAALPIEALPRVVETLTDGIQGAGERRGEYWQNRIKPYIKFVWPKLNDARTGPVSEQFARLIIAADEEFPDALATLGNWLLPSEDLSYALHKLSESELCQRFPDSALELLAKSDPAHAPWAATEIRDCLSQIKMARPQLAEDQRFVRIETIIRRAGLSV